MNKIYEHKHHRNKYRWCVDHRIICIPNREGIFWLWVDEIKNIQEVVDLL